MILAGNLEYVEHLVNTVREALLMSTDIYFDVEQNSELEEPMRQVLTLVVEGFTVLPKSKQDNYPHGKAANIYKPCPHVKPITDAGGESFEGWHCEDKQCKAMDIDVELVE